MRNFRVDWEVCLEGQSRIGPESQCCAAERFTAQDWGCLQQWKWSLLWGERYCTPSSRPWPPPVSAWAQAAFGVIFGSDKMASVGIAAIKVSATAGAANRSGRRVGRWERLRGEDVGMREKNCLSDRMTAGSHPVLAPLGCVACEGKGSEEVSPIERFRGVLRSVPEVSQDLTLSASAQLGPIQPRSKPKSDLQLRSARSEIRFSSDVP